MIGWARLDSAGKVGYRYPPAMTICGA